MYLLIFMCLKYILKPTIMICLDASLSARCCLWCRNRGRQGKKCHFSFCPPAACEVAAKLSPQAYDASLSFWALYFTLITQIRPQSALFADWYSHSWDSNPKELLRYFPLTWISACEHWVAKLYYSAAINLYCEKGEAETMDYNP